MTSAPSAARYIVQYGPAQKDAEVENLQARERQCAGVARRAGRRHSWSRPGGANPSEPRPTSGARPRRAAGVGAKPVRRPGHRRAVFFDQERSLAKLLVVDHHPTVADRRSRDAEGLAELDDLVRVALVEPRLDTREELLEQRATNRQVSAGGSRTRRRRASRTRRRSADPSARSHRPNRRGIARCRGAGTSAPSEAASRRRACPSPRSSGTRACRRGTP